MLTYVNNLMFRPKVVDVRDSMTALALKSYNVVSFCHKPVSGKTDLKEKIIILTYTISREFCTL